MNRVINNKGAQGVDGMHVDELRDFLNINWDQLKQMLMDGKYRPSPVRRVEIPKDNGSKRKLGIPTAVDRVIQQAIAQVLTPIYEPLFSENSYGFRPKRSAHDAINKCKEHLDGSYKYVVDIDLEKYFETVNHDILITLLSKTIHDGRVISLIHRYLNAGVMIKDKKEETTIGVLAGGNLSPILSNIMLNELDRELEKRGHHHVRFSDDVMIFCRTTRGAERVKKSITNFIEGKLKLKVNKEKTVVAHATKVKFLGFGFYFNKGAKVRIHPKSLKKMKNKIRYLLNKSKGNVSNEECPIRLRRYIKGWVNYFKIADMRKLLKQIDEWMRSKIRCRIWKQWKKIK
ncbi:group II intron reverse transcriptase/maturase, partial [Amedibacillus sp. YH-ame6]